MRLEELGLIGNCQYAALIRRDGAVVWCCLPRFDAEPIFGELLDPDGGRFLVGPADGSPGRQRYLENTNVLETRFEGPDGSFRVIDFAPRFIQYDRVYRPTSLVRIIEPLSGHPRVRVACAPRLGWSKLRPQMVQGSHHLSYLGYGSELRLTTDVPLSYLDDAQPFALTARRHLVLSWGQPVEEPLEPLCERFLHQTEVYWDRWVKHCEVPPMYQREVIRSALALKLHCFEDTGAIVASVTTSLPESAGSGRTWDYRYCWLRDSYFALDAFRLLGHFEERAGFLEFLLNVASGAPQLDLAPLYRIDGKLDLEERIVSGWAGYQGEQPVRVGNGAVHHRQLDVFGELVLALTPLFLDERFRREQSAPALDLMCRLGEKAMAVAGQPDASIWELRTEWTPQTFSSLMCWAAADRMVRVLADRQPARAEAFAAGAHRIKQEILARAWNPDVGAIVSSYGGKDLDASLLQAATLRFLPADDPRMHATVTAIRRDLDSHGWLMRYRIDDSFGQPTVAFVICTFWLIQALAYLGDRQGARALLDQVLGAASPLGLIGEDWDPVNQRLWGNYPQAYSHVGMIHAAFASSPGWDEVL
jgi:GH15 family glucan-1,4-alpha-glucosidase